MGYAGYREAPAPRDWVLPPFSLGTQTLNGGTLTELADGSIRATIPGGVDTSDPGDGTYITWPLTRYMRQSEPQLDLTAPNDIVLMIREITPPGLSSDTLVSIGIASEANLGSATVDAIFVSLRYVAGTRTLGIGALANGAVTEASTAGASARAAVLRPILWTPDAVTQTEEVLQHRVWGVDGSNPAQLTGAQKLLSAPAGMDFDAASLYLFVAFHRDAATAGTETVDARPLVWLPGAPASKWGPA